MKTTTTVCPVDGLTYILKYGFDRDFARRHNQAPYLSIQLMCPTNDYADISTDRIRGLFPEHPVLALLPFSGCSIQGPTHYEANTIFLAGVTDCWGLEKGERRQIRNRNTGLLSWELRLDDGTEYGERVPSNSFCDLEERPPNTFTLRWFPWCRIGEGKPRELDAARGFAVWPDATDEELSIPAEELRARLRARLPALLERFRAACETAGVEWPDD